MLTLDDDKEGFLEFLQGKDSNYRGNSPPYPQFFRRAVELDEAVLEDIFDEYNNEEYEKHSAAFIQARNTMVLRVEIEYPTGQINRGSIKFLGNTLPRYLGEYEEQRGKEES